MNKTSMPRISVITVCLNAAPSMKITLESVISQKYTNKEIIIIDGASVDGTLDVVKLYSSHIDRIVSEKDRGIYDAMNKGVALATGDYCIFMNAGDTFADCDTLAKAFQKPADADVLYGDVIKTDKNGKKTLKEQNCRITATECFSAIKAHSHGLPALKNILSIQAIQCPLTLNCIRR